MGHSENNIYIFSLTKQAIYSSRNLRKYFRLTTEQNTLLKVIDNWYEYVDMAIYFTKDMLHDYHKNDDPIYIGSVYINEFRPYMGIGKKVNIECKHVVKNFKKLKDFYLRSYDRLDNKIDIKCSKNAFKVLDSLSDYFNLSFDAMLSICFCFYYDFITNSGPDSIPEYNYYLLNTADSFQRESELISYWIVLKEKAFGSDGRINNFDYTKINNTIFYETDFRTKNLEICKEVKIVQLEGGFENFTCFKIKNDSLNEFIDEDNSSYIDEDNIFGIFKSLR